MKAEGERRKAEGGKDEKQVFPFFSAFPCPKPTALAEIKFVDDCLLELRLKALRGPRSGFTLIELVLVMAVMVTLLAIAGPRVSRSMREQVLRQEGARLQALTEFSRDEATSLGVPMTVWIDPETRRFGANVKAGYTADASHPKEYTLPSDLSFDPIQGAQPAKTQGHGFDVADFEPDGTLDPGSVASVRIVNRLQNSAVGVNLTADGYGYETVNGAGGR